MPLDDVISRLKANLLTSGLQEKNQALFYIINQLIDYVGNTSFTATAALAASTSSTSSGGSGTVTSVAGDTTYLTTVPNPIVAVGNVQATILTKSAVDVSLHTLCGGI